MLIEQGYKPEDNIEIAWSSSGTLIQIIQGGVKVEIVKEKILEVITSLGYALVEEDKTSFICRHWNKA